MTTTIILMTKVYFKVYFAEENAVLQALVSEVSGRSTELSFVLRGDRTVHRLIDRDYLTTDLTHVQTCALPCAEGFEPPYLCCR